MARHGPWAQYSTYVAYEYESRFGTKQFAPLPSSTSRYLSIVRTWYTRIIQTHEQTPQPYTNKETTEKQNETLLTRLGGQGARGKGKSQVHGRMTSCSAVFTKVVAASERVARTGQPSNFNICPEIVWERAPRATLELPAPAWVTTIKSKEY